jgi:hypothetical protein
MNVKNRVHILSVTLLILAGGCATGPAFDSRGVPQPRYLVGGGFEYSYRAPANGTLYYVEETKGKILRTMSISKGMMDDYKVDDPAKVKDVLGVDMQNAKFNLYFVPSADQGNWAAPSAAMGIR